MDYLDLAEQGRHPLILSRMESGYAVMADTQFLLGYCILLASPRVDHLTDLPMSQRTRFLRDMTLIGEAIEEVCGSEGLRRINYEILGNTDTYLHAHVIPRYHHEPTGQISMPAFTYPKDRWTDSQYQYDQEKHGVLRDQLTAAIDLRVKKHA